MSTPITCLPKRQDALFHVLYGSDYVYIQKLIEESVINICREYPTMGVHESVVYMRPHISDTLDKLRAKFFILLMQDMTMRAKLAEEKGKGHIVKHVCKYKAVYFYNALMDDIIPAFAQDQTMTHAELVNRLRDAYICS